MRHRGRCQGFRRVGGETIAIQLGALRGISIRLSTNALGELPHSFFLPTFFSWASTAEFFSGCRPRPREQRMNDALYIAIRADSTAVTSAFEGGRSFLFPYLRAKQDFKLGWVHIRLQRSLRQVEPRIACVDLSPYTSLLMYIDAPSVSLLARRIMYCVSRGSIFY